MEKEGKTKARKYSARARGGNWNWTRPRETRYPPCEHERKKKKRIAIYASHGRMMFVGPNLWRRPVSRDLGRKMLPRRVWLCGLRLITRARARGAARANFSSQSGLVVDTDCGNYRTGRRCSGLLLCNA